MAGNLSTVEKFQRMKDVRDLKDQKKSDYQISEITGLSLPAVKRNLAYIKQLDLGVLDPVIINEKRIELEEELREAAQEARGAYLEARKGKEVYDKDGKVVKTEDGTTVLIPNMKVARGFHKRWVETLVAIAKLYGLDNVRIDSFYQVNTQHNTYNDTIQLESEKANRIADIITGKG